MAPEKMTEMILTVNLKCPGCSKKVKKIISKIPQIRDQVYDVDKNMVMIKVVCCSPENIRAKLCNKGGDSIKSIEIVQNSKDPTEEPTINFEKSKDSQNAKQAANETIESEKDVPQAKPSDDKHIEPEKAKSVADMMGLVPTITGLSLIVMIMILWVTLLLLHALCVLVRR